MPRPRVTLYTDGGCHPNPGPGGWGVVVLRQGEEPVELKGAHPRSTNNRMELTAALEGLRSLGQPSDVEVVTDSVYLKDGITSWIDGWRRRGWRTTTREPVKNRDLWMDLDEAASRHRVRWRWIRGHAGERWNERAHELAAAATPRPERPPRAASDGRAVEAFVGVAVSGKAGAAAWGAVLRYDDEERELGGRLEGASANAAHIASAALALEAVKRPLPVEVVTVSDYLRDGATRWLHGWRRSGWRTREGRPVASRDWWERLGVQIDRLQVRWHVAGKDDLPPEVERARTLAREALAGGTADADEP